MAVKSILDCHAWNLQQSVNWFFSIDFYHIAQQHTERNRSCAQTPTERHLPPEVEADMPTSLHSPSESGDLCQMPLSSIALLQHLAQDFLCSQVHRFVLYIVLRWKSDWVMVEDPRWEVTEETGDGYSEGEKGPARLRATRLDRARNPWCLLWKNDTGAIEYVVSNR